MMSLLRDPELLEREEGQGLAEYALILVLIAIICFVALQVLGTTISGVLSKFPATSSDARGARSGVVGTPLTSLVAFR